MQPIDESKGEYYVNEQGYELVKAMDPFDGPDYYIDPLASGEIEQEDDATVLYEYDDGYGQPDMAFYNKKTKRLHGQTGGTPVQYTKKVTKTREVLPPRPKKVKAGTVTHIGKPKEHMKPPTVADREALQIRADAAKSIAAWKAYRVTREGATRKFNEYAKDNNYSEEEAADVVAYLDRVLNDMVELDEKYVMDKRIPAEMQKTLTSYRDQLIGLAKNSILADKMFSEIRKKFILSHFDKLIEDSKLDIEWTPDQMIAVQQEIDEAFAAYMKGQPETFSDYDTQMANNFRSMVGNDIMIMIEDIVADVIAEQNIEAGIDVAASKAKAEQTVYVETQERAGQEEISSADASFGTEKVPLNPAGNPKYFDMLQLSSSSTLFPKTMAAYEELFGRILREVFGYTNEQIFGKPETKQKGDSTTGILTEHIVRHTKADDLGNNISNRRNNRLLGTSWAVVKELGRILPKNSNLSMAIKDFVKSSTDSLRDVDYKDRSIKPNIIRAIAAFTAYRTQSKGTNIPMHIYGTAAYVQHDLQIAGDDLAYWAAMRLGLPYEVYANGRPVTVDYTSLGSAYAAVQHEQFMSEGFEEEAQSNDVDIEEEVMGGHQDNTLTAQAFAREIIRKMGELYSAELTSEDIRSDFYATDESDVSRNETREPYKAAQNASNPSVAANLVINRKIGLTGKTELVRDIDLFMTYEARNEFGRIMNETALNYANKIVRSDTFEERAVLSGILKMANKAGTLGTVITTAKNQGIIPELTSTRQIKPALTAMQVLARDLYFNNQKTGEYAKAAEQLFNEDPSLGQVHRIIEQLQAQYNNLAETVETVDNTLLYNILAIQNTLFGLKDMSNYMVQSEVMLKEDGLNKTWHRIFGIPVPETFRSLMKDLWNTSAGVLVGKVKLSELKTDSDKYKLAMYFALDAMNNDGQATLDKVFGAIDKTISILEKIQNKNVEQDYVLAVYKQYQQIQEQAGHIVNGTGTYGQQMQSFIKDTYKPLTDKYWDLFEMGKWQTAERVTYYLPRVYNAKTLQALEGEFEFSPTTGRVLKRQLADLSKAMSTGRIFHFNDFMPGLIAGMSQVINAEAHAGLIAEGLSQGYFSTNKLGGFELIEAKAAKKRVFSVRLPDGGIKEFDLFDDAVNEAKKYNAEIVPVMKDLYAPSQIATYINKITKSSTMRNHPFVLGLLATNAKLKGFKIVWGMFHRRSFIWSAMMAGEIKPDMGFKRSDWKKENNVLWKKLKSRFDYTDKRKIGLEIMSQANKELNYGLFHGLTMFKQADIGRASQQYITKMEKWMAGTNRSDLIMAMNKYGKKFSKLTNRMQDELFGIFGASLKAASFYHELLPMLEKYSEVIASEKQASMDEPKATISKHAEAYYRLYPNKKPDAYTLEDYHSKTESAIYSAVSGAMNADFGGLHTGRMGVSKDVQDAMRLLFLGPDWTASNIISALKLFPGNKGNLSGVGTAFSGSNVEHEIYKRFWLRILGRSATLFVAINALMAGLDNESAMQRLKKAKRRGGFKAAMADISPIIHMLGGDKGVDHYFNISGHFLDIPKIATDPVRMFYHKSSSVLKPVLDLTSGTRYDHKRPARLTKIGSQGLYTWENQRRGPISPSEAPAYMLYQMSQALPIQIRNMYEIAMGQENGITGIGKAVFGLDFKRSYGK
jgi:hypothetical protein